MAIPFIPVAMAFMSGFMFANSNAGKRLTNSFEEAANRVRAKTNNPMPMAPIDFDEEEARSPHMGAEDDLYEALSCIIYPIMYPEILEGGELRGEARVVRGLMYAGGFTERDIHKNLFRCALNYIRENGIKKGNNGEFVLVRTKDHILVRLEVSDGERTLEVEGNPMLLRTQERVRRADALLALLDGESFAEGTINF